jgi:putative spermidine/putrescine transport system ATP-binding protein
VSDAAAYVRLDRVSKQYAGQTVVDAVTLDVREGEMVVLLGPSGCGKTTILRMIAGFTPVSGGDILLDGRSILDLPAHLRAMGIVFQSYALFPHMSVAKNIAFGLEMRRQSAQEIASGVQEMLRLVKLEGLAQRLPRELSGGQQQRVALARALAIRPKVLLLDEPLSNLDPALRQEVARDIRILQREGGLTAIMVTHDQDEAMAMADRLVVLQDGRVQQIGSQEDLYERPQTPFVARFIGHSNILAGRLQDDALVLEDDTKLRLAMRYGSNGTCTLALRPERITLVPPQGNARVHGRIELSTYLGSVVEHVVTLGAATRLVVRNASSGGGQARVQAPGETVGLDWNDAGERLFDATDRPVPPADEAEKNSGRRVTSHA